MQDLHDLTKNIMVGNNAPDVIEPHVLSLGKDLEMICTLGESNQRGKKISAAYSRLKHAIKEILLKLKQHSEKDIEIILGTVLFKRSGATLPRIDHIGIVTASHVYLEESKKFRQEVQVYIEKPL